MNPLYIFLTVRIKVHVQKLQLLIRRANHFKTMPNFLHADQVTWCQEANSSTVKGRKSCTQSTLSVLSHEHTDWLTSNTSSIIHTMCAHTHTHKCWLWCKLNGYTKTPGSIIMKTSLSAMVSTSKAFESIYIVYNACNFQKAVFNLWAVSLWLYLNNAKTSL